MYSALASCYDLFMDGNAESRLSFVLSSLPKPPLFGADLACGTGEITLQLLSRGYNVFGVDVSGDMLSVAKQKAAGLGLNAQFVLQDMSKFASPRPLDFVTCCCDGINYVKDPSKVIARVAKELKSGGLFIFDISTEYKLRRVLANNTFSESKDSVTYIWKNFLNKDSVDMELTFFKKQGELYQKSTEAQTQFIHSTDNIMRLLSGSFTAAVFSGSGKPLKETDHRAYFLAIKK